MDCLIVLNRGMSRDPEYYHDPEEFYPERFEERPDLPDPRKFVFGFGRRLAVT